MTDGRGEETGETASGKCRTPLSMILPAAVLAGASLVIGLTPHLGSAVESAVVRFQDQAAYNATVLSGAHIAHPALRCTGGVCRSCAPASSRAQA